MKSYSPQLKQDKQTHLQQNTKTTPQRPKWPTYPTQLHHNQAEHSHNPSQNPHLPPITPPSPPITPHHPPITPPSPPPSPPISNTPTDTVSPLPTRGVVCVCCAEGVRRDGDGVGGQRRDGTEKGTSEPKGITLRGGLSTTGKCRIEKSIEKGT